MAVGTGYSKIASSGLVFAYDTGDTYNSYLGRPTDNLLANYGMSTYNNVPGNVSSNLYSTSETYRGATVWRQDLTALDGNGAYYLSNGNNPGIGVVTGGGGGLANTYTGHSIFFKPTVPMYGNPIYTNYSNIGGWQSCCSYEDMGDGWYRAYVLWYNTSTQSDGKYWAINPLSTPTGQTVTVYWAGPFKESLNSTSISQFINGTRSTTQAVINLSSVSTTVTAQNNPFNSPTINPQLNFDGTDDYLQLNQDVLSSSSPYTLNTVMKPTNLSSMDNSFPNYNTYPAGFWHHYGADGYLRWRHQGQYGDLYTHGMQNGVWGMSTISWDGSTLRLYVNGTLNNSVSCTAGYGNNNGYGGARIGMLSWRSAGNDYNYNGLAPVNQVWNRTLSDAEIKLLYGHYKTRFGLP